MPFLVAAVGDIPIITSLMRTCAHTSFEACVRCCIAGDNSSGPMRSDFYFPTALHCCPIHAACVFSTTYRESLPSCRYPTENEMCQVPTTVTNTEEPGERIPDLHLTNDAEATAELPYGSLQTSFVPRVPCTRGRAKLVRGNVLVDVHRSQLGPGEQKYSVDELIARAVYAESCTKQALNDKLKNTLSKADQSDPITVQEAVDAGLQGINCPRKRYSVWKSATAAAHDMHLRLGVAAMPIFAKLWYFKCVFP